jgi:hypothetical protein
LTRSRGRGKAVRKGIMIRSRGFSAADTQTHERHTHEQRQRHEPTCPQSRFFSHQLALWLPVL